MKHAGTAIIVINTAIMLMVMLAVITYVVLLLTSQSLVGALVMGTLIAALVGGSGWLGFRISRSMSKRNREYMERHRR